MNSKTSQERAKLWRLSHLRNLELLHATYITQSFSRHTHDGFAIGVIEQGALGFFYRGENVVASPGSINLCNPGEAHNGHAAAERGWVYRMFYLDTHLLQQAASEVAGRSRDIPFFQTGVIHDNELARWLHRLHCGLEQLDTPTLEQESRLLWTLAQMVLRHADDRPCLRPVGCEHESVKWVRDYIQENYADNLSLDQLAKVAYLSPFHLIRVFSNEVGIPPHAYLTQVRIQRAKAFLARGWPIVQVAAAAGFVDQSHLTRHFKRNVGVTPGQYRNFIQDH